MRREGQRLSERERTNQDAGGQTEQGVNVGLFEQLAADGLAGAASKRKLSGNTTAARPCCLRMVKMCWRKLSCNASAARTCSRSPGVADDDERLLRGLARFIDDRDPLFCLALVG
jgi:hypothetical protein